MRYRTGATRGQRRKLHPPAKPARAYIPRDMPVDHLLPPTTGKIVGGVLNVGVFRWRKVS